MSDAVSTCSNCQATLQPGMLRCRACGTRLASPKTKTTPESDPVGVSASSTAPAIVPIAQPAEPSIGGSTFQLGDLLAATPPATSTAERPLASAPLAASTANVAASPVTSEPVVSSPVTPAATPASTAAPSGKSASWQMTTSGVWQAPNLDQETDERLRVECVCGAKFRVKQEFIGKRAKCPKCKQPVLVALAEGSSPAVLETSHPAPNREYYADFLPLIAKLPPQVAEPREAKRTLSRFRYGALSKGIQRQDGDGGAEAEARKLKIRELGESRDERIVELVTPLLEDPWIQVREAVAFALGCSQQPAALELLVQLLDDKVPEVKRAAATAMGALGDGRATRVLLQLATQEPSLRFLAQEALSKLGAVAYPDLKAALQHADPGIVLEALVAIGRLKATELAPAVQETTAHRLALIRGQAAETLFQLGDIKSVGVLVKLLSDSVAPVRLNAARALRRLKDPKSVKAFLRLAADPDDDVVAEALIALGDLQDREAVPAILPLLHRADPKVRAAAAEALGEFREESHAAAIAPLLQDTDETVRLKAVSAFRRFRSTASADLLLPLLGDTNPSIRQRAIDALGEIGQANAVNPLIACLRTDSATEVRAAAARALGALGFATALQALEGALDDEFTVRCRAIVAMGEIKDKSVLPALLAMLRDPVGEIRYHAAMALGELGHKNAMKPLEALLADDSAIVRRGAGKALIKLGDPRGEALLDDEQLVRAKRPGMGATLLALTPSSLVGALVPCDPKGKLIAAGVPIALIGICVGIYTILASSSSSVTSHLRGSPSFTLAAPKGDFALIGRKFGQVDRVSFKDGHEEAVAITGLPTVNAVVPLAGAEEYAIVNGIQVVHWANGSRKALLPLLSAPPTEMWVRTDPPGLVYAVKGPRGELTFTWLDLPSSQPQAVFSFPERFQSGTPAVNNFVALGQRVDGLIVVFDTKQGVPLLESALPESKITSFGLSADGQYGAVWLNDGRIDLLSCRPAEGKKPSHQMLATTGESVRAVEFLTTSSPTMYVLRQTKLELWDVAKATITKTIDSKKLRGNHISVSGDGKWLVSFDDEDGKFTLLDLTSGKEVPSRN